MNDYTLSNSAGVIDSAITRVASADTQPTSNSANMVTSGGVKQYVDDQITTRQAPLTPLQGTTFNFTTQTGQSAGYEVFPSGLKMAWGLCSPRQKVDFPAGVNFTVPPTITTSSNETNSKTNRWADTIGNVTTTDFEFTGHYGTTYGPRYIAIGH